MSEWDFEEKNDNLMMFEENFKNRSQSQRAEVKRRWIDKQTSSMEDIREFEKKVLYNESKNNRN